MDLSLLRLGIQDAKEKTPLLRGFEGFVGERQSSQLSAPAATLQFWIHILALPFTHMILGEYLDL